MPTGYTAKVADRDEVTFNEFAWDCARAFGAFVNQRDDNGPPILEEEVSDYYLDAIAKAESELDEWLSLSEQQKYDRVMGNQNEQYLRMRRERDNKKRRYYRMVEMVKEWEPPTEEHVEMKHFMLDQLVESLRFDCEGWLPKNPTHESIMEEVRNGESALNESLAYHKDGYEKERERVNNRNRWKRELAESIGMPQESKP